MARYQRPSYNTDLVFAAACAAHRINGGYIKTSELDDEGNIVKSPNKNLVRDFLTGKFDISDADRAMGEKVRQYCNGISFKIITGKSLSDFEHAMLNIADKEIIDSNYDIAVASSLPATYARGQARIQQDILLREKSGCLDSALGTKVELEIEVVRCNYSNEWNTYYVTGIANDAVVYFAFRDKIEPGSKIRVKGKIKAHKGDRTQLSHAKVL